MITFLQATNRVLRRLRQSEVTTLANSSEYVKLIADFVNETKSEIEDAWEWSNLQAYFDVTTVAGTSTYSLTGTTEEFKLYDAWNTTTGYRIKGPMPLDFVNYQELTVSNPSGQAEYFSFAGVDADGYIVVNLVPNPSDTGTTYRFFGYNPQAELNTNTDDDTVILVPSRALFLGALAKAISERGEDGGAPMAEADVAYNKALGDAIAIDALKQNKYMDWYTA